MKDLFIINGPIADTAGLLREIATNFFSKPQQETLRKNDELLAEVLEQIARLESDGEQGREQFARAVRRISGDPSLSTVARMEELEKLNAEQKKTPDRLAILHDLETQYHQTFIAPANDLTRALIPRIKKQIELARQTETEIGTKFGLPHDRIEGLLVAPLQRALDVTQPDHEAGGAHSWLLRARVLPARTPADARLAA